MSEPPTAQRRTVGYELLLPPGWAQIPLRADTEHAIEAILDAATAERPPQEANWREQMTTELRKIAQRARADQGVFLYLPTAALHGLTVAAAMSVADIAFGSLDPPEPALLTQRLTAGANAKQVIIDATPCTRTEHARPADPAHATPLPYRRVDYLLPFPDDPDRWLVVTCTALRSDENADEACTEWVALFDAIMTTFLWRQQN